MKIICLDETNPQAARLYEALYTVFYYLAEYLPKIFLDTVIYNGESLQIPKLITKLHYDSLDADTRNLLNKLADIIEIQKHNG